jgi:peptidoglycan/LPS O-acetylase OafA/YrhL
MPQKISGNFGSLALDQWRGVALVLVLIAHGFHESGRVDGIGRVGVNLFFFISGVLVFRSLAGSSAAPWLHQASSFWHRRFWRLYPALMGYILVVLIGWVILQYSPDKNFDRGFNNFLNTFFAAVFYCVNYVPNPSPVFGHLWSLACEVQFYLLAPLIYLVAGRSIHRQNWIFGGSLFVLFMLGVLEPFVFKRPYDSQKYHFEFAVWPMMLGFFCEFKKDWSKLISSRWLTWANRFIMAGYSLGLLFLAIVGYKSKELTVALGTLLLLPCFLAYVIGSPFPNPMGGVLRWLGVRTYSIYLWQQSFTICYFLPIAWWPAGVLASVGIGSAWFRLLEQPFLSINRRIKGGGT